MGKLLYSLSLAALLPFCQAYAEPIEFTDSDLIEYALSKAITYSGLPALTREKMPRIYQLSREELKDTVCPDDESICRNLVAVFDDITYRILIRDDFNLLAAFDISFLIHEMVHALQYNAQGPNIFKDCGAIFKTETEAYSAQDKFLAREGEFYRASIYLRFFYCDPKVAHRDYLKSLLHWKKRRIP